MVTMAGDLKDAGINVPLLVCGDVLSEKFTKGEIGPNYSAPTFYANYAKDAMTGLRLMSETMDPELREQVLSRHIFRDEPSLAVEREPVTVPSGGLCS
jgi:cobalamin-dependent methionine synthase I